MAIPIWNLPLDRHPSRGRRRQDRNALYQNIFHMAVREYEYRGVCPIFSLASEDRLVTLGSVRRFSTGTLGPVAFGLGLRDSCLVILFFNLICAIPPAYL
jgi:hypothetical protein